ASADASVWRELAAAARAAPPRCFLIAGVGCIHWPQSVARAWAGERSEIETIVRAALEELLTYETVCAGGVDVLPDGKPVTKATMTVAETALRQLAAMWPALYPFDSTQPPIARRRQVEALLRAESMPSVAA